VQSTGNIIQGVGDVVGGITLVDSGSQLTWNLQGMLKSSMTMNDGTLTVMSDLQCGRGVQLLGGGKVVLGGNTFKFGSKDLAISSDVYWASTDGVV